MRKRKVLGQGSSTKSSRKMTSTSSEDLEEGPFSKVSNEVLAEILQRVDSRTLVSVCKLVCRRWYEQLGAEGFWVPRCLEAPPKAAREDHDFDLARIAVLRPFGRNLIRNPSGEDGLVEPTAAQPSRHFWGGGAFPSKPGPMHWHCTASGGDGWVVETPPVGTAPESIDDFPICFATSYHDCEKVQIIDLFKIGVDAYTMDELKPTITVSEWHAGRWDCGTRYALCVELLGQVNGDFSSSASVSQELLSSSSNFAFRESFEDEKQTAGLGENDWTESHHVFSEYPSGVRFIRFRSTGSDTQFWAGHFGPKMAKASVRISFQ